MGALINVVHPVDSRHSHDFMGFPVHDFTFRETCNRFREAIRSKTQLVHTVVNANKVLMAHLDPVLAHAIEEADIVNPDGQSIVWFGRLSGIPFPERVTGIDLMASLLQIADEESASVYLLGATQEVVDAVVQQIKIRFSGISRIEGRNGYFLAEEEMEVCRKIHSFQPDILFIGMSSPYKERFAQEHRNHLGATIIMGVGGSFDIWAGKTKRAPQLWQRAGLEWFYRFLQEPRRMWRRYLIGNVHFVAAWMKWSWNRK